MQIEYRLMPSPAQGSSHQRLDTWYSPTRVAFVIWNRVAVWELPVGQETLQLVPTGDIAAQEGIDDSWRDDRRFVRDQSGVITSWSDFAKSPVAHPLTGDLLTFDSRIVQLIDPLTRAPRETKTLPKAMVSRRLARRNPWIVFGELSGNVRRLTLQDGAFGRVEKITTTKRPLRDVALTHDDGLLFVGGAGDLQLLENQGKKFAPVARIESATRELEPLDDHHLVVNRGIHGLMVIDAREGLEVVTTKELPFPIDQLRVATNRGTILATSQRFGDDFALISVLP